MSKTCATVDREGRQIFVRWGATISRVSATPVMYATQVGSSMEHFGYRSLPVTLARTRAPLAVGAVKSKASAQVHAFKYMPLTKSSVELIAAFIARTVVVGRRPPQASLSCAEAPKKGCGTSKSYSQDTSTPAKSSSFRSTISFLMASKVIGMKPL